MAEYAGALLYKALQTKYKAEKAEAQANLEIYFTNKVGVAEEVLCSNCILDLKKDSYIPTKEDVNNNYQNVQKYGIINHKTNYLKMFEEVVDNGTESINNWGQWNGWFSPL